MLKVTPVLMVVIGTAVLCLVLAPAQLSADAASVIAGGCACSDSGPGTACGPSGEAICMRNYWYDCEEYASGGDGLCSDSWTGCDITGPGWHCTKHSTNVCEF